MRGILEVFGISALVLLLVAIARFLWKRYIAKREVNRHALLEPFAAEANGSQWAFAITYRLPVQGRVEVTIKIDGVPGPTLLNKHHSPGYYTFNCVLENPGKRNQLCFKAPGTYIEKNIVLA